MTLRDLCQRWFGLGAPDRYTHDYRHDLESASRSFRACCTGAMRSVFPSSLVHLLLRYCEHGDFREAPLFVQQHDVLGGSGWQWMSSDDLVLQLELSQIAESSIMRGTWSTVKGFTDDVLFLLFKYRGLSFYPVFDVTQEILTSMLNLGGRVLYYIPPFQCPMSQLQQVVQSRQFTCVADFLLDLHSPVRLSDHYQVLFFLYGGTPVWVLSPLAARLCPETISVTRIKYMMEHDTFFKVELKNIHQVTTVLHYQ